MSISLRTFEPVMPSELLNGVYGEWIIMGLLSFFFIAVAGVTLPKHLTNRKYSKPLIVTIGLILGIGLYKAIDIYNFNFESFGFAAIFILIIIVSFIVYGIVKSQLRKDLAITVSYCIMFLTFFLMTPSLFDSISKSLPILNGIFILCFIYSVGAILVKGFGATNDPGMIIDKLKSIKIKSPKDVETEEEIKKEIKDDKKENKLIKKKTMGVTKLELKTVDDIDKNLGQMIKTVNEKGSNIEYQDIAQITHNLRKIYKDENILTQGWSTLRAHANAYKRLHRREIPELEKRYSKTTDPKEKNIIKDELKYQKMMPKVLNFMEQVESKQSMNISQFNNLLSSAATRMKNKQPRRARALMQEANNGLGQIKKSYEQQIKFEKYLLKCGKKTILDLKREKKQINQPDHQTQG